jgi:hypothetical protein
MIWDGRRQVSSENAQLVLGANVQRAPTTV